MSYLSFTISLFEGAHYISHGLIRGAEKVAELMDCGTPKLIKKINPEPVPQPVNPKLSQGLKVAKDVTGTAVQITGFMGENQFPCVQMRTVV